MNGARAASAPASSTHGHETALAAIAAGLAASGRWVAARAGDGAEALVLAALGGITFATSADHVLQVGQENGVTGWQAWSVAGTVEIIAAYAGLEVKRRRRWRRVLPLIVFAGSAAFLIAANLQAASGLSLWGKAYHVVPPVAFLAVMLIAETKRWQPHPKAAPAAVPVAAAEGAPELAPAGAPGAAPGPVPEGDAGDAAAGTVGDRILAALADGPKSRAQLVAAGCGNDGTVKTALGRLAKRGEIAAGTGAQRGMWRVKAKKLAVVS